MSRLLLPHHIERRSPARVRRDAGRTLDRSAIVASLFPAAMLVGICWRVFA